MTESILIEVSPGETRVAFVDDQEKLREFVVERVSRRPLVEGIYRGRVVRIEKGMGAAFVDIGVDENVFLSRAGSLHEGEVIVVQVSREAASGKAPTVRRDIAISGSYLVYRPEGEGIRWPRSLKSSRRRHDLESQLLPLVEAAEGWTVRTAAQWAEDDSLISEMTELRTLWRRLSGESKAPSCLLPPPTMVDRIIRDRVTEDTVILIDDRGTFLDLTARLKPYRPAVAANIRFHDALSPMYDEYGVSDQLEELSDRTLVLPRGARLTFDHTEALTVIDVDMGSAGGRSGADDAILSTNMSAVVEIARQIRLRNLAGLIIVDFITMRRREHRRKLVDAIKRELKDSTVPVDVLGMTAAGLVEITRRRDGPTLHEIMTNLRTSVIQPSDERLICEALRQLLRTKGVGEFRLIVSPKLSALARSDYAAAFEETNRRLGGALSLVEDANEPRFRIESQIRTGS